MPAFTPSTLRELQNVLVTLQARRMHYLESALTHDDMLRAIVRPEHREMLTTITEIAYVSSSASSVTIDRKDHATGINCSVNMTISTPSGNVPFLLPRYANQTKFDTPESKEAAGKLDAWLAMRVEIGREIAIARAVLDELYHSSDTIAAMHLFWPGVTLLLNESQDARCKRLAESLSRFRIPKTLPRMTPELRAGIKDASTAITKAIMLPPIETEKPHEPVRLYLSNADLIPVPWSPDMKLSVV
jgi:hypothetical protein